MNQKNCPCIRLNCRVRGDCTACRKRHLKKAFSVSCEREAKTFQVRSFSLVPFTHSHYELVQKWVEKGDVLNWFGKPDDWMRGIAKPVGNWIHPFILYYKKTSVGQCLYFDCSKTGAGYAWDLEPSGTFGIDYRIGEEPFVNAESILIKLLCSLVQENENPVTLLADAAAGNYSRKQELLKNNFVFDEQTFLYRRSFQ